MKKLNFVVLLLMFSTVYAQQFEEIADLQGVLYGEVLWLDSQNNGIDKLVVSGYDVDYNNFSAIYSYENGELTETDISIEPFGYASMDKLDMNQDGFTDFIITGYDTNSDEVIHLYINDGFGGFTEQILPIAGVTTGKIRTADLNNDGLDDFIISGVSEDGYIAKLYLNDGAGGFSVHETPFFGNSFGNIEIFDANNDGNLDVLLTGFNNNGDPDTQLYLNDGEANFTEHDSGLPAVYFSATSAGDYDNDGDLDILITGFDSSYNEYTALYKNDGEANFTIDSSTTLKQLYWGSASFVDYNHDGDLDIFLTGTNSSDEVFALLYKNDNGVFTEDTLACQAISGTYISSANWTSLEGEENSGLVVSGLNGDMEAITKVYKNTITAPTYCEIDESNLEIVEAIYSVDFAGIDNSSAMNTSDIYEDFTDIVGNVTPGETYSITVKGDLGLMMSSIIHVYIDWNQNGVLDDEGEAYNIGVMADWNTGSTLTAEISIPEEALQGNTRMRIIKDSQINSSPCQGPTWGQVEDYTIHVAGDSSDCSGNIPGLNPGDNGCVSFEYNGNNVQYSTVRGADGKVWLQQNLGSNQIAESATDENAFGDLFQWGRWDDGHQSRDSEESNTLPDPNNPAGLGDGSPYFYSTSPEWWKNGNSSDTWEADSPQNVSETNGCDPCKALGQDWRLPTASEWQDLVDAENISDIASAFSSNLKLTVAGARSDSGVYNAGEKGYYWSKSTSDNSDFSKYLYYSNYIVNTTAGGFREQGSSIRCIYAYTEPVSCEQPQNVSIDYITDTTANISWDEASSDTEGYNWLLVAQADEPDESNAIQNGNLADGSTNLNLTDLSPGTSYDFYIQTICEEANSDFTEPNSFTTYATPPENTKLCDAIPLSYNQGCLGGPYTNVEAFEEPNEPVGSCLNDFHGTNSVWFSFIAPADGVAVVSTNFNSTDFNTELAAFEGPEDCEDMTSLGEEVGCATSSNDMTLENLIPGVIYYVKVTGLNNAEGNFCIEIQTSENLEIEDEIFKSFTFYPNPVKNQLTLKASNLIEKIEVYNLLGQKVITEKPAALETQLNVEKLQSGVYLMKTKINGTTKTFKIIKK